MLQGGDDLDDDFVVDDLVAFSDDENLIVDDNVYFSDTAEELKNVRHEQEEPQQTISAVDLTLKKRKRREKEKERKAKKRKIAESVEAVDRPLAAQPSLELSAFLASFQAKTFPKLSAIELGDMQIPESSIADTTSWEGPRTLDHLVDFIINAIPTLRIRLAQKSKSNGSPTLLFVTSAALRVADVTRILKEKKLRGEKGGEVAKLFAKHFKLADHVTYLKRTKVGSAVGTPGRLGKLLCETDALTVSALSHIILDISFRDSKNRSLLDIPETRDEVFKTVLGGPQVLQAIKEGKIQVVLF